MEPWNLKTLEPWNFGTMKPWNLKFLGLYTTNDHHAKLSSLFWQLPVCIIQAHLLAVRDLCTTAQMFKFGSFYQSSHHVTCSPQGLFPCVERLLDKKREPWHFLLADVNASQPPLEPEWIPYQDAACPSMVRCCQDASGPLLSRHSRPSFEIQDLVNLDGLLITCKTSWELCICIFSAHQPQKKPLSSM